MVERATAALKIEDEEAVLPKCGLVMPISEIDGLSEGHWKDVKDILVDALRTAGYTARLVSSSEGASIIQKSIVQNIYSDPLIICDVSAKNPNVMFELGLRLAFDKPTIVVKDDITSYSFDTSPIEHLTYPRDLRYNRISDFKNNLAEKVRATMIHHNNHDSGGGFLKAFGEFTVPKLETKEVGIQEFLLEQVTLLNKKVDALGNRNFEKLEQSDRSISPDKLVMRVFDLNEDELNRLVIDIDKSAHAIKTQKNILTDGSALLSIFGHPGTSLNIGAIQELIEVYQARSDKTASRLRARAIKTKIGTG